MRILQAANSKKAFTLLEVMIFTAILSIVLVSTAAFVSRLIYNLKINEHKIYANLFATEVQEWLFAEREASWTGLYNKSANPASVYCMNTQLTFDYEMADLPAAGACANFNGLNPPIYKRELELFRESTSVVRATVTVTWNEGPQLYTERIESLYTSY